MILNNRSLLKLKNPNLFEKLSSTVTNQVEIVLAKNGEQTLAVTIDGKQKFVHSKYNPSNEANVFVDNLGDLSLNQHVFFIGTGLGYHIEGILQAYPQINYSIFEPNPEILQAFLNRVDLTKFKKNKLVEIIQSPEQIQNLELFVHHLSSGSVTVTWSVTRQIESERIENFEKLLLEHLKKKKQSAAVSYSFQKVWTVNAFKNLVEVVKTKNILSKKETSSLKGKPVILVAAGPSLSYEIENLRKIKEAKSAYIFAVGSAVKALIAQNIIPDAFFSYDPGLQNYKVVEEVKENSLPIPFIFGSTVGFETIQDYPGEKYHFITNQDPIFSTLVKQDLIITDAPSIAVITAQILAKLNASPIILAGQNLSFFNEKRYADGISYDSVSNSMTEDEIAKSITIKDVAGNDILTSETYLLMKNSLEQKISQNQNVQFLNTTQQGADIKGAPFVELEKLMQTHLKQNVVNDDWLKELAYEDKQQVLQVMNDCKTDINELLRHMKKMIPLLKEIESIQKTFFYKKMGDLFIQYDILADQVNNNNFFKKYILPMIHLQHEKFVLRSPEVKQAKLAKDKLKLFIEIFGSYNVAIIDAINILEPIINEISLEEIKE